MSHDYQLVCDLDTRHTLSSGHTMQEGDRCINMECKGHYYARKRQYQSVEGSLRFATDQPQLNPTRIIYLHTSDDLRNTTQEIIRELAWLLPRWLEDLKVGYTACSSDSIADMHCHDEYRTAALNVFPEWFNADNDERVYTLIHEFIHVFNFPMTVHTQHLIDELFPDSDGAAHRLTKQQRIEINERATQDLATCIYYKMYNKQPPTSLHLNLKEKP